MPTTPTYRVRDDRHGPRWFFRPCPGEPRGIWNIGVTVDKRETIDENTAKTKTIIVGSWTKTTTNILYALFVFSVCLWLVNVSLIMFVLLFVVLSMGHRLDGPSTKPRTTKQHSWTKHTENTNNAYHIFDSGVSMAPLIVLVLAVVSSMVSLCSTVSDAPGLPWGGVRKITLGRASHLSPCLSGWLALTVYIYITTIYILTYIKLYIWERPYISCGQNTS